MQKVGLEQRILFGYARTVVTGKGPGQAAAPAVKIKNELTPSFV